MTLTLEAQVRTEKADVLREKALVPAVIYGPKSEPQNIAISKVPFKKAFIEAGESTVVTLNLDGTNIDTLIHDVQFHPVSQDPIHVDFYVFDKDVKQEVEVPLEFTGEAPAVKSLGGILVKVLHEITVEALPKDLPHEITVDITSLATFEDQIKVSQLVPPHGVTFITEADEVVALVEEPREEEPEEEAPTDISSVEIEKKGKKEEEGETPTEEKKEG